MLKETLDEALEEQSDSSTDEGDGDPSQEGKDTPASPLPFHEDPKVQDYLARQLAQSTGPLEQKIKDLEARLNPPTITTTEVPEWFGGNQKQWDAFQADRKAEREEWKKETREELKAEREAEEKRNAEAKSRLDTSIRGIEEKLGRDLSDSEYKDFLDYTAKHRFIDAENNWDYVASWASYSEVKRIVPKPKVNQDRRKVHEVDADEVTDDSQLEVATHDSLKDVDM